MWGVTSSASLILHMSRLKNNFSFIDLDLSRLKNNFSFIDLAPVQAKEQLGTITKEYKRF